MAKILVVDDERVYRKSVALTLRKLSHEVLECEDETQAIEAIKNQSFDLIILDMRMPLKSGGQEDPESGLRVISKAIDSDPNVPIIVITAYGSIENAVEAMRRGAYDYLTKPFSADELKLKATNALKQRELTQENLRLSKENVQLKQEVHKRYQFSNIVGQSDVMQKLFKEIEIAAQYDYTVLIRGETGTGKELVAKAIHYNSPRKDKPLVTLECTSLSESLIESELFGHKKGSFTGAISDRKGAFETADGGTIFLDEIGDMPQEAQSKLLRVLEQKEIKPVGEDRSKKVDVRVIAATNQDLEDASSEGKFRQDLLNRLNIITLFIPPLRQRKEDIPFLAKHFVKQISGEIGKRVDGISPQALKVIDQYDWPGNVRELENTLRRTIIFMEGDMIEPEDLRLSEESRQKSQAEEDFIVNLVANKMSLQDAKEHLEKLFISRILEENHWNIPKAAEDLGLQRTYLYKKIQDYNLRRMDKS
jgi:DNA-binding NtrC family response regulator